MCIVFTCGEHEFSSELKGYEGVTCQCHNCGNHSATVMKRWNWFTFCFVPILPLSTHAYKDVVCRICGFAQPLENRQDVQQQHRGAGNEMQPQGQPGPGYNQQQPGWGPPQGQQQPGAKANMTYG
ncbi:hypothetical protein VC83_06455 [Pseudogymnoascus destructans]|uniref:Uncharacterized protein n=2 Tax=Pseudogymnoascus destructans TaxID=655981 RepID=L8FP15_PSED2|nr:uncharacterized protein VC83_06455 [Pseudogymnoascus destructans]ELR02294.1 hypothetical protein GMDG_05363 [Pseudogymnoascus destructans 20631-21]OAF58386.1 hypothetical protein VC83_06455 [Pseudogymnoascus destructans]